MNATLLSRAEQFTVEIARAMPQLSIPQAISAALQLGEVINLRRIDSLEEMRRQVNHLELRAGPEWEAFGYLPTAQAAPISIEAPRERSSTPLEFTAHYLSRHTSKVAHRGPSLPSYQEHTTAWRRRLHPSCTNEAYRGFALQGIGRAIPHRRELMLGNLWRLGIVARWAEKSGLRTNSTPLPGELPHPTMNEWDCWYLIELDPRLGKDFFPELVRQVAQLLLCPPGENSPLIGAESEAAAYLALERLWLPARQHRTHWFDQYARGAGMPREFRWREVYRTAESLEDLFRGDVVPYNLFA